MKTITLTATQTEPFGEATACGYRFRHEVRVDALNMSLSNGHCLVEIHSADGIVLDALRSDSDEELDLGVRVSL